MLVVLAHTDLRLYWPHRTSALRAFLAERDAQLRVVEIAGKGSNYDFSHEDAGPRNNWTCLFPDKRVEDLRPAAAAAALSGCLDGLQPDIVLAGAVAFPSGAASLAWCKANRRPIVIFDDVRVGDVPRGRFVQFVKRRLYRHIDAAFTAAPGHAPASLKWGVRPEAIFYGVDAVNNERFAAIADKARADAEQTRRRLDLPARFVLGVGRLIERKNYRALIRSYADFSARNPGADWHIVIVGEGPERSSLQRLVSDLGVTDRAVFRAFVPQETLASIYALAGAAILPSYGETWGLVVNEAMACGLPVLVSDQCGCAATLVRPGENGWTFDPDDIDGLSALLARVAAMSDAERKRMGDRSQQIIADWGLPRFCSGAWQAIQFATANPLPPPPLADRLLMSLWKGRYRPT